MKKYKLGDVIHKVEGNKNKQLKDLPLLGINIEKEFMPSVANTIGTDMSNYQIVKKEQFACNPMHLGRDERMPTALLLDRDEILVSPAYFVFEIIDKNIILPEYLMLYFKRPETDRLLWFKTDSSVRGGLGWNEFCAVELSIPSIEKQKKIVEQYNQITESIKIKERLNNNLEQQAFTIFDSEFPKIYIGDFKIGDYINPKRGKGLLSKDAIYGDVPVVAGGIKCSTYHNVANTKAPVVTISASGANAGYINLWHIPVWSSDSSFIDENITPNVYFWYVLLKKRQKEIYDIQTGSAQPHIYPQHIEILSVAEIDNNKVENFNKKVTQIFETIGTNIKEINALEKLRETLLPNLMLEES